MNKKGDVPGWAYIVGLILGLIALVFFIYFSAKSGRLTLEAFEWLR